MTFTPFSGYDPCDGADERVTLSRDNPLRHLNGGFYRDMLANDVALRRDDPDALAPSNPFHEASNTMGEQQNHVG